MLALFYKLTKRFFSAQWSFSQSGEDAIMLAHVFKTGHKKTTYLDIGANDPIRLNNSYLLYLNGANGVLVEPHPVLSQKLKQKRKRDKVLNVGVGTDDRNNVDFFIMTQLSELMFKL
ncbi:MAG TPA: hypothetical protein ENJ28_00670 [Gammaproteobacteria bacterium]|nr:hypothetical protein [Gammaproteobacteria bacterium]